MPTQITNEDVLRVYHTILSCYRQSCPHLGMRTYTERSLAAAHQELANRGLSKADDDDTSPDEFAGYGDLEVSGFTLRQLLPPEGMRALLDYAYKVRSKQREVRIALGKSYLPFYFRLVSNMDSLIRSWWGFRCLWKLKDFTINHHPHHHPLWTWEVRHGNP